MPTEIPSFHDGYLIGIQLLDKEVRLSLKRYNGERWEIVLMGVETLQIDDFRQGNIIDLFEVICNARPDADLLERLYGRPHPLAHQKYHDAHASLIEQKAALVEGGQAILLSIIPAYGADLVALASGISATQLTT